MIYALAILATYRLTLLLTADTISAPLRRWYLFRCPWCVSVWVGGIIAAGLWRWPEITPWALTPFALSACVIIMNALIHRLGPVIAVPLDGQAPPAVTPEQLATLGKLTEFELRRLTHRMEAFTAKNRRLERLTVEEEKAIVEKVKAEMGLVPAQDGPRGARA